MLRVGESVILDGKKGWCNGEKSRFVGYSCDAGDSRCVFCGRYLSFASRSDGKDVRADRFSLGRPDDNREDPI